MRKFSLTALTLMTTLTRSAAEIFEVPVSNNDNFDRKGIENSTTSGFRRYISIDISSLLNLYARVNFGMRNENGHNGYDLGVFGAAGGGLISTFGGYASYLYHFNPESNVNFYSGIGLDSGLLWTLHTYGANARAIIPVGLNHLAQSGRHEFFQLSFFWPSVTFQKLYKKEEGNYYFFRSHIKQINSFEYEYSQNHYGRKSSLKGDLKNIGLCVNYGLFF
jgi:hypothetical protein